MIIDSFRGEFSYLSNFSNHGFTDKNGYYWKTVEHYYQAQKATNRVDKLKVKEANTPGQAKKIGSKIKLRKDWNNVKVDVMREALYMKFDQNFDIRRNLVTTQGYELIEGNTWGDDWWGVYKGKGLNVLGKLLMEIRDQIIREERRI